MVKDFFYTNIRQSGKNLLFIGYEKGKRVCLKYPYEPELFIPSPTKTKYVDIFGNSLQKKKFKTMYEAGQYIKEYGSVSGFNIYGSKNFPAQFVARTFKDEIEYDISLIRFFTIDIETWCKDEFPDADSAKYPITLLSIHDSKTNKKYCWGTKPYSNNDPRVEYKHYPLEKEADMLNDFLTFWTMNYPDVVTGWNSRLYDIKYIINRLVIILGDMSVSRLSPWGIVSPKKIQVKRYSEMTEENVYDIVGISDLDYMDLYKKYWPNKEPTYSLDYIAGKHLGYKKIKYKGTLHELYENEYDKFVLYNLRDIDLVVDLETKLKYLSLIIEVSYAGFVPDYMDALGTTRFWETLIHHHLLQQNIVVPVKIGTGEKGEKYEGGFVKEPAPSMFKWVVSFDVTSLYPSIIRTLNIGAETLVSNDNAFVTVDMLLNRKYDTSYIKSKNYALSANGNFYLKDKQSFFSELMEKIFNKRVHYNTLKKAEKDATLEKIYDIKQYALKILINGFYGAMGTPYFQFYNLDNAKSVTLTGQYIIRSIEDKINIALNRILGTTVNPSDFVVAIDTDSNYVDLSKIVDKYFVNKNASDEEIRVFLDKFSKNYMQKIIDEAIVDCLEYINVYQNVISMKRESICNKCIWTGKKHYVMNVLDKEGKIYSTPEIVAKGVEIVKSSTPDMCRTALKDAVKIIMQGTNDELIEYLKTYKTKFFSSLPEDIAFPRTANGITKYSNTTYKVPIQVRAAKNFNKLVDKHTLYNKYSALKDGAKIKCLYLKTPNPIFSNVIGFTDTLPAEFGVDKYVDYHTMYDKYFLLPLKSITDVIGWDVERKRALF